MHATFTKISNFEMIIEATVEPSFVDKAIRDIVLISDEDYEKEIRVAQELGVQFDDLKERESWWWKVADYLARKTLKKETDLQGIGRQDLHNFQATFSEPPQRGRPFHFKAKFPYYIPTKKIVSSEPRKPEPELPSVSLMVVNVPIRRTEREMMDLFKKSGRVLAVRFMAHSLTGEKLDAMKVAFGSEDEAIDAYFRFSGSYVGHDQPMKIRFMNRDLQFVVAERGDVVGSFHEPVHYFKQGE